MAKKQFKRKKITPYTLVKFKDGPMKDWYKENHPEFPPLLHDRLLFVSEISNMPGHCLLMTCNGQVLAGYYHMEELVPLTVDET